MKKFISVLLVVAIVAVCAISVSAGFADQEKRDDLLNLIKDYKIELKNGTVLTFEDSDINATKNYLSSYEGTVTQEMIDLVKSKIDANAEIVINSGFPLKTIKDIKKFTYTDRKTILKNTNDALVAFGLVANYNAVTNKVDYKDITTQALVYESDAILKKSGDAVNVAPIAIVSVAVAIAVIGCAVIVKKYALAK